MLVRAGALAMRGLRGTGSLCSWSGCCGQERAEGWGEVRRQRPGQSRALLGCRGPQEARAHFLGGERRWCGVLLGDGAVVAGARELARACWGQGRALGWGAGTLAGTALQAALPSAGERQTGEAALPLLSKNWTDALQGLTLCCRKGFTAARSYHSRCLGCEQCSRRHRVCSFPSLL